MKHSPTATMTNVHTKTSLHRNLPAQSPPYTETSLHRPVQSQDGLSGHLGSIQANGWVMTLSTWCSMQVSLYKQALEKNPVFVLETHEQSSPEKSTWNARISHFPPPLGGLFPPRTDNQTHSVMHTNVLGSSSVFKLGHSVWVSVAVSGGVSFVYLCVFINDMSVYFCFLTVRGRARVYVCVWGAAESALIIPVRAWIVYPLHDEL